MIADIYASRKDRRFILVRFARDQVGLSVTHGEFLAFGWGQFKTEGLAAVKQAVADYSTARKAGPSQFDRMSREERTAFLGGHVGLEVAQRDTNLWWIDLMRPGGDGSMVGPVGPPYRVQFRPTEGPGRFFDALLHLLLLDEGYSEN